MRHLIGFAVGVLLLSGCSQGSFLERRFDNFTAHYNTFYNASRTFKSQERQLLKQERPVALDEYIDVFVLPEGGGRSSEFEKVITKCADLLRKHPRSKWVDDALLLIGKSYYYQSNYVGAEQKFNEVVDLDGPLTDEARLWLARTLVASESFEVAGDLIDEVLSDEQLQARWQGRYSLLKGDLHARSGNWEAAAEALEAGLKLKVGGELAARATFLLGQVYETIERYEDAERAYNDVRRHKPRYELDYAGLYNRAAVEGLFLDAGKGDEAVRRMMRDDKHFSKMEQLDLLRAQILQTDGYIDDAIDLYAEMLYPPEGVRPTSLRGEAHYRLGELYRDGTGDYYLASMHFDTAATILRRPQSSQDLYTPHAIVDAQQISTVFSTYREVTERIAEYDSLLFLGTLNDAEFDSAITELRVRLAEQAARQQEELERRRAEARFRNPGSVANESGRRPAATRAGAANTGASGFLNHRDIQRVQEGFLRFRELWGDRPRVPGWRRLEAVQVAVAETVQNGEGSPDGNGGTNVELMMILPPVDVSSVPRDSLSTVKMEDDRAEARYQLANVMFLSMERPDSAAYWYRLVVTEDESRPVAQRATYAMAEVQQALGDSSAATTLYEQIVRRYPNSDFAVRARERLGRPAVEQLKDSLDVAAELYASAYGRWGDGDHAVALEEMLRTAADYAKTPTAPKAMLASGLIFMEWARDDSLDVRDVIPMRPDLFSEEEHTAARAAVEPVDLDTVQSVPANPDQNVDEALGPPLEEPVDTTAVRAPESAVRGRLGDSLSVEDETRGDPRSRRRDALRSRGAARDSLDGGDVMPAAGLFRDSTLAEFATGLSRDSTLAESATGLSRDSTLAEFATGLSRDSTLAEFATGLSRDSTLAEFATGLSRDSTLAQFAADPFQDSTRVGSVPNVLRDSTLVVPTDSALSGSMMPEITEAQAEALEPEEPEGPPEPAYFLMGIVPFPATLTSLFQSIETNYPISPHAARARELRHAVAGYHEEKERYADSVRTAVRDSIAAILAADSLASARVADSLAALAAPMPDVAIDTTGIAFETDSTAIVTDSSGAAVDPRLPGIPDSLGQAADSLAARSDSSAVFPVPSDSLSQEGGALDEGPAHVPIQGGEDEPVTLPPHLQREEEEGLVPDSMSTSPARLREGE